MEMHDKQRDSRFAAFTANRLPSNSFYSHIRNAAITLKLHGLFPFENLHSDDGRSLSFKWFSWSTLWGFLLYTGSSIVLGLLAFNRSGSRLLRAMEYINDKFAALGEPVKPRWGVNTTKFWIIFEVVAVAFLCLCAVINLLSDSKSIPATEFALTVVMAVINTYLELYISVMYLVMTSLILFHYERLNHRVDEVFHAQHTDKVLLNIFENLRILHTDLTDASNYLMDWFSLTMISLVLSLVSRTLIKTAFIFFITRRISLTNDSLMLLFRFLYIFILATACHKLVKSK